MNNLCIRGILLLAVPTLWLLTAAAHAQQPISEDVVITYERTQTVSLAVSGIPPITETTQTNIQRSSTGTESSECRPYGRRSSATTSSSANVSNAAQGHFTASLAAKATSNGGHYRTCVAGCIANNCVGIIGNDTRSDASASSAIRVKFAFGDHILQEVFDLRLFSSLPNELKLKMTAPNGTQTEPKTGTVRLLVKPGDIFYINATLDVASSNEGGCCSNTMTLDGLLDIHVEKPPILASKVKVEPFIVGGVQTEAYKNVVAILLKGELHCTGTVIGEKTILTAAHCINGYESRIAHGDMTYLTGTVVTSPQSGPFAINQATYPRGTDGIQYSPATYDHDVGLLYTPNPIVAPATSLHKQGSQPLWSDIINKHALIFVGFGYNKTEDGALVALGIKREATWNANNADDWRFYFQAADRNTCKGDSGGPAFYLDDATRRLLLVGITSIGDKNCNFGADTRVDSHYSWITSRIR